jgi:hypothetical protein
MPKDLKTKESNEDYEKTLEEEIAKREVIKFLKFIGVSKKFKGYGYLFSAIYLYRTMDEYQIGQNKTMVQIYEIIAKENNILRQSVAQAIGVVISDCWHKKNLRNHSVSACTFNMFFPNCVCTPTPAKFIKVASMASKLVSNSQEESFLALN